MKINFSVLLICLGCMGTMQAQNKIQTTSNVGIKGGYNLSAITYDGSEETGHRHGFHVGMYGNSSITNTLALQMELLYSQQGYKIEDNSGTFIQKLDYINLPLMLQIYPVQSFYLESGAQIGWAVSHKEIVDSNFDLFDTETTFNPYTFDWGFNFGAGIKLDSGLNFGVRYHLGMGEIYEEGGTKNRIWQFSMGIDF
ncbi:PorT family protein [Flavobacteriaceae bacterium F08102]|nr:PorT family protein [Flavobacteriaceae bacterium F08102]